MREMSRTEATRYVVVVVGPEGHEEPVQWFSLASEAHRCRQGMENSWEPDTKYRCEVRVTS